MGWTAKRGRDVDGSIARCLLSLAELADAAAGRSWIVRWLVLWYIRQADAVVREFVAGSEWNTAGRLWSPVLPVVRYGTSPADALGLAISLRALAAVVLDTAAQERSRSNLPSGQASNDGAYEKAPHPDVSLRSLAAAAAPVELRDTS